MLVTGCGDDEAPARDSDETTSETTSETGDDNATPPALLSEPEIVFHANQPMVVDVIVALDRPGVVELSHDDDPGVRAVSLAIEDEGRSHHLRVRGLAPGSTHALTLALRDSDDPTLSATQPLSFTTKPPQPGFRPSFDVELSDAAALDPAYRLFDYAYLPLTDPVGIFVIDPQGITRWYYNGGPPGWLGTTAIWAGVELLDDGSILATRDGAVTVIDELGEQRLNFAAAVYDLPVFHHEVVRLANGNFLTLSNSFETLDYSSFGLDEDQLVAGDLLVEFTPAGEVAWTWDSFDHLDPLRVRSTVSEGLPYYDRKSGKYGFDWTHGNGMTEIPEADLILLSMRHQDWIVAIDHQTGELAWRLGPEGDFELLEGSWFHRQHSPQWWPDGSLLLYDNAVGIPEIASDELRSRAVRYTLDFDAMTATQVWDSVYGEPYLSAAAGDADRTPAGNVLVLDSALQPDPEAFDLGKNYSRVVELDSEGPASPIWTLTTKLGSYVYRATAIDRLPGESAD
ncbi:MAG: aryl-sulfate sulfotransferase [Enhygromyxa sp.]